MNKVQIQIVQINNGWLINTPPSLEVMQAAQQAGQQPTPDMFYCEDMSAVALYLNGLKVN